MSAIRIRSGRPTASSRRGTGVGIAESCPAYSLIYKDCRSARTDTIAPSLQDTTAPPVPRIDDAFGCRGPSISRKASHYAVSKKERRGAAIRRGWAAPSHSVSFYQAQARSSSSFILGSTDGI